MFRKFMRIFTRSQPVLSQPQATIPLYSKLLPQVVRTFNEKISLLILTFGIGTYLTYRALLLKKNPITHKLNLHILLPQIEKLIGMYVTSNVIKELGESNSPPPIILDQICSKINSILMKKYNALPIKSIAYIKNCLPILFLTQNNTLIVSSGALENYENSDEMAFEIIHETCHLIMGHQSYRLFRGHTKINSSLNPINISNTTPMADRLRYLKCDCRVGNSILFAKEADADEMTVQLMGECGYNVKNGTNILLKNFKSKCRAKEYGAIVRYYSDRYNRIISIIDEE